MYELCFASGEGGRGISREEYIDKIADGVLTKLPAEFELDKVRKKYGLEISPTTVVLFQELERFNKLIKRMKVSLQTLRRVRKLWGCICTVFIFGFTFILKLVALLLLTLKYLSFSKVYRVNNHTWFFAGFER